MKICLKIRTKINGHIKKLEFICKNYRKNIRYLPNLGDKIFASPKTPFHLRFRPKFWQLLWKLAGPSHSYCIPNPDVWENFQSNFTKISKFYTKNLKIIIFLVIFTKFKIFKRKPTWQYYFNNFFLNFTRKKALSFKMWKNSRFHAYFTKFWIKKCSYKIIPRNLWSIFGIRRMKFTLSKLFQ